MHEQSPPPLLRTAFEAGADTTVATAGVDAVAGFAVLAAGTAEVPGLPVGPVACYARVSLFADV